MVRLCRSFLILTALLSGVAALGADSAGNRAYRVAEKAFQLGSWDYAESKFGEFVVKYPQSAQVPEAILFQGKARYQLKHFADVVVLLSTNRPKAGIWADEYLYWTAQAQVRVTNYQAAARTFGELRQGFPDSPRRLEATIAEATALSRVREWQRVAALLEEPAGVFQKAAKTEPANPFVLRGYLLLGEAQLALSNFPAVQAGLDSLNREDLKPEVAWWREYVRCRLQLAEGQAQAAFENTSNLLAAASALAPAPTGTNPPAQPDIAEDAAGIPAASMLAESWSFRAVTLETLNRLAEAISAYTNNLSADTPVDQQRHALFKISDLYMAQNDYAMAAKTLQEYLERPAGSQAADMALLTIGELQLKQYEFAKTNSARAVAASPATTNLIEQALARFDELLTSFPQSPLAGKALLDKGWCFWTDHQYAQSLEWFRQAAERLPFSRDQAVARFKWADAQFMLQDYAGAVTNYDFVATQYASLPDLRPQLLELALYQTVRAALPDNVTAAYEAMRRIMDLYPNSFAGPHCLLLLGQGLAEQGDPAEARKLFADFERIYPTNSLLPEVVLAVARSYERERNWDAAADQYTDWIQRFTNHADLPRGLPRAEFYRAWDNSMAGRVTNAFGLFTNFIARFATNELAPQAQWWIADYYFNQGQFHDAVTNYLWIYQNTNWRSSELTYQALMMAGRAAMASYGSKDAFELFTNLAANAACPIDLRIQAGFAAGDALMSRTDTDPTNRPADLQEAISWFSTIPQSYPTNPLAPLALGSMGNCYLQLADADHPKFYENASNAYSRVLGSPLARISARSQARVGLGLVAEGLAKLKTGDEQTALLKQALENYLGVFIYEDNLRDGEEPDLFWVREAGNRAGRVAETLQQWEQAITIYQKLEAWLPQLQFTLEKKILNAQKNLARERE
jgi:TolA-binding protein